MLAMKLKKVEAEQIVCEYPDIRGWLNRLTYQAYTTLAKHQWLSGDMVDWWLQYRLMTLSKVDRSRFVLQIQVCLNCFIIL